MHFDHSLTRAGWPFNLTLRSSVRAGMSISLVSGLQELQSVTRSLQNLRGLGWALQKLQSVALLLQKLQKVNIRGFPMHFDPSLTRAGWQFSFPIQFDPSLKRAGWYVHLTIRSCVRALSVSSDP